MPAHGRAKELAAQFECPLFLQSWDNWQDIIQPNLGLVPSPGIAPDKFRLCFPDSRRWNEFGFSHQISPIEGKLIGITGSNGKSTVCLWLTHALIKLGLNAHACGNIGVSFAHKVNEQKDQEALYVVELSSYQLEKGSLPPFDLALLLNLEPDHLARHGYMDAYAAAKGRLLSFMDQDGCLLYLDLDQAEQIPLSYGKSHVHFNQGAVDRLGHELDVLGDDLIFLGDMYLKIYDLPLLGRHNAFNALCVIWALVRLFPQLPKETIMDSLMGFAGAPYRLQVHLPEKGNQIFVNDSKATNVDAVFAAIAAMPKGCFLLLGGKPKQGEDWDRLGKCIAQHECRVGVCWRLKGRSRLSIGDGSLNRN